MHVQRQFPRRVTCRGSVWHIVYGCPAGADDAELLSKVTLHAARSADGVAVGRNARLRLLPLPTPRWPDLLVAHAPEDRCRACCVLRAGRTRPRVAAGVVTSSKC